MQTYAHASCGKTEGLPPFHNPTDFTERAGITLYHKPSPYKHAQSLKSSKPIIIGSSVNA